MPRTKEFEMDGCQIRYASLTVIQVEKFLEKKIADSEIVNKQVRQWTLDMICDSLNNATGASNGDRWTGDRIVAEMDAKFIFGLRDAIMEFSDLRILTEPQEKKVPTEPEQVPVPSTS